ncbi:unnamed protein product [Microthlaspi erraticum]|uniref:PRP8 domain-containing protein n=1 Tax=Microthlaspi erraticum TaxID=1685480 RepID=A0A6D2KUP0_9BRAS|nr:unnamed protein product [Microthlaspi erraticum]
MRGGLYYRRTGLVNLCLILRPHQWSMSTPSSLSASVEDQFDYRRTSEKFWIEIQFLWGNYDSEDVSLCISERFTEITSINPSGYGIVIGIDFPYHSYGAYGNWFPGLKTVVDRALKDFMKKSNSRERIRNELHLRGTKSQDLKEIFSDDQITWLVDDTVAYMPTFRSGVAFIVDPRKGELYLKVFKSSAFSCKKSRPGRLATQKTAEEVAQLVRSHPVEDQPKQIIAIREELLEPMKSALVGYSTNIVVNKIKLPELPLQGLLKMKLFGDVFSDSTKPKMVKFSNIYDDWLESISSYEAFSRLGLILRALSKDKNSESVKRILSLEGSVLTPPNCVWPALTLEQWMKVELDLAFHLSASTTASLR